MGGNVADVITAPRQIIVMDILISFQFCFYLSIIHRFVRIQINLKIPIKSKNNNQSLHRNQSIPFISELNSQGPDERPSLGGNGTRAGAREDVDALNGG